MRNGEKRAGSAGYSKTWAIAVLILNRSVFGRSPCLLQRNASVMKVDARDVLSWSSTRHL